MGIRKPENIKFNKSLYKFNLRKYITYIFIIGNTNMEHSNSKKRCITLFIQGHGKLIYGNIIPEDDAKRVSMLNFSGGAERCGTMESCCKPVTIKHNKGADISGVKLYGPQLDMMVIEYIHHVYYETNELIRPNNRCLESEHAMKVINEGLPLVYANRNIPYFHDIVDAPEIMPEPAEPFVIQKPYNDKNYSLYPNIHENCSSTTSDCSEGKCVLLQKNKQYCPEYGITIVHSSNEDDLAWTLAGIPIGGDLLQVNLNQYDSQNDITTEFLDEYSEEPQFTHQKSTYKHWKGKLENRYFIKQRDLKQKIQHIKTRQGEEIDNELLDKYTNDLKSINSKHREMVTKYDLMTRILDVHTPISKQSYELLPRIKLSDIIDIFINGMGFHQLYIIDPSCNVFDVIVTVEQVNDVDTKVRRRSGKRPYYKKVYNNLDLESIKSIPKRPFNITRKRANTFGGKKCKRKGKSIRRR